jgi:UrcA family protein
MAAAGALGLCLAASPAVAQDDEYADDPAYAEQSNDAQMSDNDADDNDADDTAMDDEAMEETADADTGDTEMAAAEEDVIVSAPSIRTQPGGTLRPGKMLASARVSYSDLDLRTREGAHELRERVRETASEICDGLSAQYPADGGDYRTCYKEAVSNGLVRANAAIDDARSYAYRH